MNAPQELFEKYMGRRLSKREKTALTDLLGEEAGRAAFTRYVADWTLMGEAIRQMRSLEAEQEKSRSSVRRFPYRQTLALAASLLILAGLFAIRTVRGRDPWLAAMRTEGRISRIGNRFVTEAESYGRLDWRDGTRLAMGPNTTIEIVFHPETGAVTVEHERGLLYLDVAKRADPFLVQSGQVAVEVLGTRLVAESEKLVAVLQGHVRMRWKDFSTAVEAGQRAFCEQEPGTGLPQLRVASEPMRPSELGWLARVGLDPHSLVPDPVLPAPAPNADNRLDTGSYILSDQGNWTFDRQAAGALAIRQTNPNGGTIAFGPRNRRRGTFAFRFRLLERPGPDAGVGVGFHHALGSDLFLLNQAIQPWFASYDRFVLRSHFEIGANDTLATLLEVWPESRPDLKQEFRFQKTPANSAMVKRRDLCRVGLTAYRCAIEFQYPILYSVAWTTGSKINAPDSPDLIAFYSFQEGSGTVVRDIAGIGEPMDMTIEQPQHAQWLFDALRIAGPADIRYRGDAPRLREAWKRQGGLTFEYWVRAPEEWDEHTQTNRDILLLSAGAAQLRWQIAFRPQSANTGRNATVFEDADGRGLVRYAPTSDPKDLLERRFERAIELHRSRSPIGVHIAPPFEKDNPNPVPWKGDLLALAIYSRPFTAKELLAAIRAD